MTERDQFILVDLQNSHTDFTLLGIKPAPAWANRDFGVFIPRIADIATIEPGGWNATGKELRVCFLFKWSMQMPE